MQYSCRLRRKYEANKTTQKRCKYRCKFDASNHTRKTTQKRCNIVINYDANTRQIIRRKNDANIDANSTQNIGQLHFASNGWGTTSHCDAKTTPLGNTTQTRRKSGLCLHRFCVVFVNTTQIRRKRDATMLLVSTIKVFPNCVQA